jgi:hypothetical protein
VAMGDEVMLYLTKDAKRIHAKPVEETENE